MESFVWDILFQVVRLPVLIFPQQEYRVVLLHFAPKGMPTSCIDYLNLGLTIFGNAYS